MPKHIYTKEERRAQFLKTGLTMARKVGAAKVTAKSIADKHNVTAALVFHVFGNRQGLADALAVEAKKQNVKLADVAANKKAPARKRSIAEVKAIKNKVAAKKITVGADGIPKKPVAAKKAKKAPVRKVSQSSRNGKFVSKATVAADPAGTMTRTVKPRAPKKAPVAAKKPRAPKKVEAKPETWVPAPVVPSNVD